MDKLLHFVGSVADDLIFLKISYINLHKFKKQIYKYKVYLYVNKIKI